MDDTGIDPVVHRSALARLRVINTVSRAARPVACAILADAGDHRVVSPVILDVATGSGDVALRVFARLRETSLDPRLVVCDRSETALAVAEAAARVAGVAVQTRKWDVIANGIPLDDQAIDYAMCTLFLHHLESEHAVGLLREMARVSRRAVVVSDLRRCGIGHVAARVAGTLSGSRVVRVDAPRSVEGAFTETEFGTIAGRAGLDGVVVRRSFPWRMLLVWKRPA